MWERDGEESQVVYITLCDVMRRTAERLSAAAWHTR